MQNFIKHFIRVAPGMWTCVRDGEFQCPSGRIQVAVGTTFSKGTNYMGFDVAARLEEEYLMNNGHATPQSILQDATRDEIRPPASRPGA